MKKIINRIRAYGIFSNTLKIIALICMVLDHIAYYFSSYIPLPICRVMRYIGRSAMPIFVFLLVQGFFKTKNLKKYFTRISIFAVVTQMVITACVYVNKSLTPEYSINVYTKGNILFSFAITLLILKVIHEPIVLKRYTTDQNIIVKIIAVIILLSIYIVIPIDYGTVVPIFATMLYAIERLKITVMMAKDSSAISLKGIALSSLDTCTIEKIYKGLIVLAFIVTIIFCDLHFLAIFALFPILLYNGERKVQRKKTQLLYYVFFPAHYVLLYCIALLMKGGIVL